MKHHVLSISHYQRWINEPFTAFYRSWITKLKLWVSFTVINHDPLWTIIKPSLTMINHPVTINSLTNLNWSPIPIARLRQAPRKGWGGKTWSCEGQGTTGLLLAALWVIGNIWLITNGQYRWWLMVNNRWWFIIGENNTQECIFIWRFLKMGVPPN